MPLYSETQRPHRLLLALVIVLSGVLGGVIFIQQIVRGKPVGDDPLPDWGAALLALLLCIAMPVLFLMFTMETTVAPGRVEVRWRPFSHRVFRTQEIAGAAARTYRPIREFGGWGIRGWGANRAYSMQGDQGVQLVLTNGDRVMIGTQRPQELEAAIDSILLH